MPGAVVILVPAILIAATFGGYFLLGLLEGIAIFVLALICAIVFFRLRAAALVKSDSDSA